MPFYAKFAIIGVIMIQLAHTHTELYYTKCEANTNLLTNGHMHTMINLGDSCHASFIYIHA